MKSLTIPAARTGGLWRGYIGLRTLLAATLRTLYGKRYGVKVETQKFLLLYCKCSMPRQLGCKNSKQCSERHSARSEAGRERDDTARVHCSNNEGKPTARENPHTLARSGGQEWRRPGGKAKPAAGVEPAVVVRPTAGVGNYSGGDPAEVGSSQPTQRG